MFWLYFSNMGSCRTIYGQALQSLAFQSPFPTHTVTGSMTCSCQNPSRAQILSPEWVSLCVVDHGITTSVHFPALLFISMDRMMVTIFISSGLRAYICSWSSFDPGHPTAILQTPASSSPLTIFFQVTGITWSVTTI